MVRCARVIALLITLLTATASAHEVRPAFLQLVEVEPELFDVMWKQPVLQNRRLPLEPALPANCEKRAERAPELTGDALLEQWQVRCDLTTGTLGIGGLTRTLTDVLVRISYLDGEQIQLLLRPDEPSMDLATTTPSSWGYLILGVEHLLFGIDHILFVIGLVLFIRGFWPLLKTITAFTVAHSVTLAMSVLGWVYVPQAPVEAIIALSIVFLARELMLPQEQRSVLTTTRPWIMAFGFGLLHGFGFAGALADIGLPKDQLALSLFLFNVGIELGQLLIVALLLAGAWLFLRLLQTPASTAVRLQSAAALGMGCLAAYWTLDRVVQILV